jgi:hypothetical protein
MAGLLLDGLFSPSNQPASRLGRAWLAAGEFLV